MERAFISLITGKAWDLPKAPQRLKAFRTALNVRRLGLTFCSAICFKRSYKTHTDWCRSYLRMRLHDKTAVTYHYQLPFLIVLLLYFWGGCDQGVEGVHIRYSSKTFKVFSSGTAHLENSSKKIVLSVKNALTCQSVVQQVSVSAERFGISAVLSNQAHIQSSEIKLVKKRMSRSSRTSYLHHASDQSAVWTCVRLRQQRKDSLSVIILSVGKRDKVSSHDMHFLNFVLLHRYSTSHCFGIT